MNDLHAELSRLERAKERPNTPAVARYIEGMLAKVRAQLGENGLAPHNDGLRTAAKETLPLINAESQTSAVDATLEERLAAIEDAQRDQATRLEILEARAGLDAAAARAHHTAALAKATAAKDFHERALAKLGTEPRCRTEQFCNTTQTPSTKGTTP